MSKSMTGFGRAESEDICSKSYTVEIKSVNHRYLDVNVKLPRNYTQLETRIRNLIKSKLKRGKVDVFLSYNKLNTEDLELTFNKDLADNYFDCLKSIKDRYDVRDDISISLLARYPDIISLEKKEDDIEEIWTGLKGLVEIALEGIVKMRTEEGEKLVEDIILKVDTISKLLYTIETKAPLVVIEYKNKLEKRIDELVQREDIDETRIANEVAIFADKASIDEEIVRLRSHLAQIKETFKLDEPIGRKLDFIIQEMNREANTIASKSTDLETVNCVIDIKNLIEKIREQVQNIE